MAKRSKSNSGIDESVLNSLYYYILYNSRTDWTKHVIPARTYDPRTGFFVEGYMSCPAIIKDLKQEARFEIAYPFIFFKKEIYVAVDTIFPSKRKITKIVDGMQELIEVPDLHPVEIIPLERISDIFGYYKINFTKPELENLLNQTIPQHIEMQLVKAGTKRRCLITGDTLDTYSKFEKMTVNINFSGMKTEPTMSEVKDNLQEIYNQYLYCDKCSLGVARKARNCGSPTFGRQGLTKIQDIKSIKSKIFIIGEAPGMQEEETKISFYPEAPAGGVLDKVLSAAGINKNQCYFTNSVLCRPESTSKDSQNGKPNAEHIDACNSRLKNELAIINPLVVLLLGRVAYRAFYGKEPENVLKMVGWLNDEKTIYFAPHPSFVVRELTFANPDGKAEIKSKYLDHFRAISDRIK